MNANRSRAQRAAVVIYLLVIAVNLLVLPTWFTPGRFPLSSRIALVLLNVLLIAWCAVKVTTLLGANPLRRRGPHPSGQLREDYGEDLYDRGRDTDELPRLDGGEDRLRRG